MGNYILQYWKKIEDGEVAVSKRVRQQYEKIVHELRDPRDPWIFDLERASAPIEFIERFCRHSKGKWIGQPMRLELWQKALLQAVFGFVHRETGYRRCREFMLLVGRKNGKALALDTPIPTPNGWKYMKDIQPGDYVFGSDGKPTKVIYTSPVFIGHKCYEVEFEDGEKIIADAEHIWTVITKESRKTLKYIPKSNRKLVRQDYRDGNGYFNITTEEMVKDFAYKRRDGKGIEYKYRVPMNQAIEYPEADLPIHPYVLGVWLGDGYSEDNRITCSAEDVEELYNNLRGCGIDVAVKKYSSTSAFTILLGHKIGTHNNVLDKLRELNVLNNKHIPKIYLHASIEQRMELLRGLMDTDGYVSKAGQCEFVQKDKTLINDFSELLSSLGIKHTIREKIARCNGKDAGVVYSVLFFCDQTNPCFKLKRKLQRLKPKLHDRMNNKSIVSIKEVESVPTKCICVEAENGLYLAGKRMTVTHNSTLLSGIALYMLIGDGEGGAETYCVASKRDQARIVFSEAVNMVSQSPALRKHLKKRKTDLYFPVAFGKFEPLASESHSLDGLNSHCVIIDELHAIKDRNLYDVMRQSMAAREQPLLAMITTAGFVRECIYDDIYDYACRVLDGVVDDERFLAFLYELDDRSEWVDFRAWEKANPGLGTIKSYEELAASVERAKNDANFLPTVLTKDFNVRETVAGTWLTFEQINNEETFALSEIENCYAVTGTDLSSTTDLSCATILVMKPDGKKYVLQQYFLPEELVEQRTKEDRIPYDRWSERGLLTLCPGNKVDYSMVTQWYLRMYQEHGIHMIWNGYDPWNSQYWVDEMKEYGFQMEIVRQGAKTLSQPMKELAADLAAKQINYNNNPILKWCLTNTSVKRDDNDNIRPIKGSNQRQRIDGAVSLLIAYTVLFNHLNDYKALI